MKDQPCNNCITKENRIEERQYYEQKLTEIVDKINNLPYCPCSNNSNWNSLQLITSNSSTKYNVTSKSHISTHIMYL